MQQNSEPAVATEGLVVEFASRRSRVRALDGVTLSAQRGLVTTILGTNGAGKSTLLRVLQGLLAPTEGRAETLGRSVTARTAEDRARVGVMLQESGLPPAARPKDFLPHLARFYAHPRAPQELEARLGIDEFRHTPIRRLSGGQRQRVALAAAVIGRPELCMLDEPSAGLDPVSRTMVVEFIESLRDEGTSIILTTHLLDDAERLSDTVHILSRGRVRRSGTLEELTSSSSSRTLSLTASPAAAPAVERLRAAAAAEGLEVTMTTTPRTLRFNAHGHVSPALVRLAADCGASPGEPPVSLSVTQADLTDLFFQTAQEDA
ncbi:ABC transporter ATP-binding protein [Falsarthrobacter nasiphocae]|uniref:ABC-2 type transport system ATP-binding protein n=1 Tax=Falsarthrobacter nasiphocae TaxID=189863 RepID=A0AAE3YD03_9MICC|nr:ABC transporter ATP-binding protein [Falsarthrobacter nasiphocae]MDR6891149.1 ABC-2 type transport system ATP-binding protein [Falsarthrobacter nasiphocae]